MLAFILSWRYFTRKRVAIAAIMAIALIVMMVTIVLNVMSGLVNEVRGKNHKWSGDIVISRSSLVGFDHYDEFTQILNDCNYILAVTPIISAFGITSDNIPAMVYGIEPSTFTSVCAPGKLLNSETLNMTPENCYAGKYFFDYYCYPGMNLNITFPGLNYRGLLAGPEAGQNQSFICADSYRTGMPDVDNCIYLDFNKLQQLTWMAGQDNHPPRTHQLRVKLQPNTNIEHAQQQINTLWQNFVSEMDKTNSASLLKDVKIQTWYQDRRTTIAPLENEKNMMTLVFAIIAVVCSFIIFAIFHMIVLDKRRDIGIIKSFGGSHAMLARTYLYFGILIGLIGTSIGAAIGITFVTHTNQIQEYLYAKTGFMLWPPDLYSIDRIPDIVIPSETTAICLAAILFSVLGAVAPAILAARQKPVDSLR